MWYRVVLLVVVTSLVAVSVAPREGAAQDRSQFRRELNQVRQGLSQIRRDMTPFSQLITDLSGGLRQALSSITFAISSIELASKPGPDNPDEALQQRQLLPAQARRSIQRAIAVSQCLAQGSDGSCRALPNLRSARIREIEQRYRLKLDEVGLIALIQRFTEDITTGLEEAQAGLDAICNQVSDSGIEPCGKIFDKIDDIEKKIEVEALQSLKEALEDPEDGLTSLDYARKLLLELEEARERAREIYLDIGQAVRLLREVLQLLVKLKPAPPSSEQAAP